MRVKDEVRATSVVQRLKVGEVFTDNDGEWEVVRPTQHINAEAVKLWLRRYPNGQRTQGYVYDVGFQVRMIRN